MILKLRNISTGNIGKGIVCRDTSSSFAKARADGVRVHPSLKLGLMDYGLLVTGCWLLVAGYELVVALLVMGY